MKKINITTARKLFNKGEKIYVLPNKVALGNPWISPSLIEKLTMRHLIILSMPIVLICRVSLALVAHSMSMIKKRGLKLWQNA